MNLFLNKFSFVLILLTAFLFPIFTVPFFTDPFVLPKQVLVFSVVLILAAIATIRAVKGGEVIITRTPFDWPLLGFSLTLVVATFLSVSIFESIVATVSILSLILFYYLLINIVSAQKEAEQFTIALILGATIFSVFLILAFLKVSLPFATIGPPTGGLPSALFLLPVVFLGWSVSKSFISRSSVVAGLCFLGTVVVSISFLLTVYQVFAPPPGGGAPRLLVLPYEFGIQVSTGVIGQNLQTLLFGSGPGTFLTDFTRFVNARFNSTPFWNSVFFSSSSFLLEILATGGLLAFLFLVFLIMKFIQHRDNSFVYLALILAVVILVLLPVTFPFLFALFVILALHTLNLAKTKPELVHETKFSPPINILSLVVVGLSIVAVLVGFYFGGRFFLGDFLFQKSLVAASQNRGLDTYNLQKQALEVSLSRDSFYRVSSQTNLALANNLSQDLRTRQASPSAQEQQTIFTLVQQAITNGRAATAISGQNFLNWQNLGRIYRSLIGWGRDAENFAINSLAQAVVLYPTSPTLRLELGGIYYQLGRWDEAQRQFEIAVNLKGDFANAYYNLGHALENKGELERALGQYQAVEVLLGRDASTRDSDNYKKIVAEINALKERVGKEGAKVEAVKLPAGPVTAQEPIQVSTPSSQLPTQKPKVEIPGTQ